MKKYIKFLLTLILILSFSVSLFACFPAKSKEDKSDEPKNEDEYVEDVPVSPSYDTTDYYLVHNGISEYKIVYPNVPNGEEENKYIVFARQELIGFFAEATNITLEAVPDTDNSVVWSESAKFISLGETNLVSASHVADNLVREDLNFTGYSVRNAGESVFLIGGRENGVVNAVYAFLKKQFNFECFASDEINLDTNVKNEKLIDFSSCPEGDKVVPSIPFYVAGQNELMLNPTYARRLGMSMQDDFIIELGGSFQHNFLGTIPPEVYFDEHPDWFNDTKGQLCLSRDPDGLADEVCKKIIDVLEADPKAYAIGFTQEDDAGWCGCTTCNTKTEEYGAVSGIQINFMNILWDKLYNSYLKNHDREVYLFMFAYQSTEGAPVKNGEITITLNDHIFVQLAPIYAAGYYSYDYVNNETGVDNASSYVEWMNNWKKVTPNIMFWSYSFYYQAQMYPYFDFMNMQETYRYIANSGSVYLFDEDHSGLATVWSDFSRLKFYLRSHLAWDVDRTDLPELEKSFFVNYYKEASDTMYELFKEYSLTYAQIIKENGLRGKGAELDIKKREYWSKGMLDKWMNMFDQALDDIAYLEDSDYDTWKKLEERIRLDSISLRYLCEQLYGSCEYKGNGNTILEDCKYFGINYI